ncbi:diguanylate cyclase domain-containing protein [Sedimenticola thiotaurini]|uniref:Sensor domain-containing diguanylate cyclase n=1 Tax=Sedimenticola thiotaurini TaxID=1543721 RepID=A0A0F7JTD4_9GAMM|nr:diguanylate cyclase [Sedimenticola thiotaurini]AKH19771.1 hypothetical protein AAY24_04690 [Sedimenticola thiotaurini]
MRQTYSPFVLGAIALIISLGVTFLIAYDQTRKHEQVSSNQTLTYLSSVHARLESAFNSTIYLNRALSIIITAENGISQEKFHRIARELMDDNPYVHNVAVAEGYVIKLVYPLATNKAILGLDYTQIPSQYDAVKRAIDTRKTVVAGPLELVQGGRAFINRTPIFKSSFSGKADSGDFWGIASMVIDMDAIFKFADLPEPGARYRIAIRGKDGLGVDGEVFYGDPALFEQDAQLMDVTYPNGSWQLAAVQTSDHSPLTENLLWIMIFGVLTSLLVAVLTVIIYRNSLRIKHIAMHDQLTRLPNRLLFDERVSQALAHAKRHQEQVAIAVLDLNKFKPVNDTYGHLAGDYVLQQVASRIRTTLRQEDIVARTGGDEFTILLVGINSLQDINIIATKLADRLHEPFIWKGQKLSVGVSIGIALYPTHGDDLTELFHHADIAMYQAKHAPDTSWLLAGQPMENQASDAPQTP